MKKFFKTKKSFIIAVALLIGIAGTASTFALLTSATGTVTNSFSLADVNTHIEEDLDENKVEANTVMKKAPSVKNDGPSICFIRARITITPSTSGVKLYAGTWTNENFESKLEVYSNGTFYTNGSWIYNANDGFFYYTKPVAVGANTETLFDAFELQNNADVTVYQEAVHSGTYTNVGESVEVSVIQQLFADVNSTN